MQRQTVFINPQYSTNNTDSNSAGWYTTSPANTSNLALRTSYSNIGISGEIRLNREVAPVKFQGFDGNVWVDFNATTGPQGNAGLDFTNQVNFNNLLFSADNSNIVVLGSIFSTTVSNVAAGISNVDIRSLQGGNVVISSGDTVSSLVITQNSNVITLNSQPLPYIWDFTGNSDIAIYKSLAGDALFKAYGEVSKWKVKTGSTVNKGTSVRITNDGSNIAITPITYSPSTHINPFATPYNILGIALEDVSGGNTCNVCVKGVTTVVCTSNTSIDFFPTAGISDPGLPGLVGCDSGIFCNSMIPSGEYIRAGFFLESGVSIAGNGQYVLFYVDTKLSSG